MPAARQRNHTKRSRHTGIAGLSQALLSLQFKATALVVVLTLSVTGVVAFYLIKSSGNLARQQYGEQMLASATLLAKAAAPLISADPSALDRLAKESAKGQPLMHVTFSDTQGTMLAASGYRPDNLVREQNRDVDGSSTPGLPVLRSETEDGPMLMDLTYPITSRADGVHGSNAAKTRLLGYVRVSMEANTWQRSMESRLDLLVGVGVLALVAAIPLGFLLIRRIVGPLEDLSQAMLSFSMGKLDVRSSIRRRDELGRLAQAFNQMADQHQQTHMRIVRLNAELEERVAYRTHQLRELASRDPLTGLYNRRYFSEVLERCYAEAIRYHTALSCIMIDLDDFKSANDAFGHQVGDQVLQLAAGTIVGQLRTADVAARYGGDEFILLLPQTDADRTHVLGERIVERFNSELGERVPGSTVRMSMGIASLQTLESENAESLIQAADHALYMAKTAGKNRIVMAVPAA
jgi:diguanylate cyclase (GGDEF)-like protein